MGKRLLITVLSSLFLATFLVPQIGAIIYYGRLPNFCRSQINSGMTKAEVVATFGRPHVIEEEPDGERWYYFNDFFGITYYGIKFSPEGLVMYSWL